MKNFFSVFRTSFKLCWREPVTVGILTVFPIVIIFVLGNALSGFISPDTSLEPIPVAAVIQNDENFKEFLLSGEISRFLEVNITDEATARDMLESGSVSLIVNEKDGVLSVIRPNTGGTKTQIASAVIDSYSQIGAATAMAVMSGGDISELLSIIEADISVTNAPLGKRVPNATDYYAVTMLVMILMFTGLNGLELFMRGLLSETGNRILISPVSKPAVVGGLLAASTLTSYLQGLITFFFSMFVYGVYWGENIPLIMLTLLAVTLFSQALSLFFLMVCKNGNAAMGLLQALIWTMTFVSDGYTKVEFGAAEKIFQYSPNALAHTVIFGTAYGGDESKITFSLGLILIYGAALYILSFILGKRRFGS